MSKIIIVMCALAASLSKVSALTNKERGILLGIAAPSLIECGSDYGVTRADLRASTKANSANAFFSCYLACLFKKHDFLNDKGLFTAEKGMAELRRRAGNEVDLTAYDQISKACSKANDQAVGDGKAGCERAALVMDCAIKSNVDLPF